MTREKMKQMPDRFCCSLCSPNKMFDCDARVVSCQELMYYLISIKDYD
jgi:hypothetical protein